MSAASPPAAAPARSLRLWDAVAMIVGIVVGAGIFRTPALVAANTSDAAGVVAVWVLGGVVSLVGALCYAELASAFPNAGGEYHFLSRAFGPTVAFFYAWARVTIIPTGSIALLAFVFGDYAAQLVSFGPGSSAIYAAALIVVLTSVNVLGLRFGRMVQNALTVAEVLGLVCIIVVGLWHTPHEGGAVSAAASPATNIGLAMVFVLLAYGGWNEAAYLSAEVKGDRRSLGIALLAGVAVVTVLYVLANVAYLRVLGVNGLRGANTVGADLMRVAIGPSGAALASALIALSAFTSANATIVMGSRTGYALGRDFHTFRALGHWDAKADAPVRALLVQGTVALALVALGALTRRGFETMVEYTAPVFWVFFLLTGLSLFVLRVRAPGAPRAFRAPLYPLTPAVFVASSAWLLYSSIAHVKLGAMLGLAVLLLGAVPLLLDRARARGSHNPLVERRA